MSQFTTADIDTSKSPTGAPIPVKDNMQYSRNSGVGLVLEEHRRGLIRMYEYDLIKREQSNDMQPNEEVDLIFQQNADSRNQAQEDV